MTLYSSELETALSRYITSTGKESRDRLRELLKNESVDTRHQLLMNVRGSFEVCTSLTYRRIFLGIKCSALTGIHTAVYADDVETVRYMLDNFSANHKHDVIGIQDSSKWTALLYAAALGRTSIINYLLSNLSQQQKYDLLKFQNNEGDTRLHSS